MRPPAPRLLALILIAMLAGQAAGQVCQPSWVRRFMAADAEAAGQAGRLASTVVFDDDGPGPHAPALYASGGFASIGGVAAPGLARWNGAVWAAVGSGAAGGGELAVFDDDGPGPHAAALYALGRVGTTPGVIKWDGSQWTLVAAIYGTDPWVAASHLFVLEVDGAGPGLARLYVAESIQDVTPAVFTGSGRLYRLDGVGLTMVFGGGDISSAVVFDRDGPGPLGPEIVVAHTMSWFAWSSPGPPPARLESRVTRLSAAGPVDLVASTSDEGAYAALAVFDDDGAGPAAASLYVGGFYELTAGGAPGHHLSRLVGSGLAPVAGDVDGPLRRLVVLGADPYAAGQPAMYALGEFGHVGGIAARSIARWNGTAWAALGPGFDLTTQWNTTAGAVNTLSVFDDDGAGARPAFLYAGGAFTAVGTARASGIARWNGQVWLPPGPIVNNKVHALLAADVGAGPSLYIGGRFTIADGVPVSGIVRWDGLALSALPGMNNHVDALALSGGQLFAAGKFTMAGGVAAGRIARWNGAGWSALGTGLDGHARALAVYDDGGGPALYAGGLFGTAGGVDAPHVARWNGQAWAGLGDGLDGDVNAIAVYAGELVVGGAFTSAGGVPATFVARWDGDAWRPAAAGPGFPVSALAVHRGVLYAGGSRPAPTGNSPGAISAWTGQSWSALPDLTGPGPVVRLTALASIDEDGPGPGQPVLYVSGDFGYAGATRAERLARWDGLSWSAVSPGLDAAALAFTPSPFGDHAFYLGGEFRSAGGRPAWFLAVYAGCPPTSCYVNCDGSTTAPVLNVGDFVCFQQRFAAADPYANCDGSTAPPVLNVADFVCFQQRFAAGCP